MYCEFYGLEEMPFNLVPDPDYLFMSSQYQQALSVLEYGLTKDGFAIITGDVGTGKTTLVRKLLDRDDSKYTVGLLNHTV
ncbi:AAA family ATPase, partial [Ketobacter sp.]